MFHLLLDIMLKQLLGLMDSHIYHIFVFLNLIVRIDFVLVHFNKTVNITDKISLLTDITQFIPVSIVSNENSQPTDKSSTKDTVSGGFQIKITVSHFL